MQNVFFGSCKDKEHCYDIMGNFKAGDVIDPMGPEKKSSFHMLRAFDGSKGKLNRSINPSGAYFRLAVKVKDVIDNIK